MNKESKEKKGNKVVKNKGKKKKNIFLRVILILILVIIIAGAILLYKRYKDEGWSGVSKTLLGHNEDTVNSLDKMYCLILGQSQNLTDTIILASYDPKTQEAALLSIPRDTFIGDDPAYASAWDKINAVYQNGPENTLEEVRELTGINVQYYLKVDTEALKALVDEIGGVYFDVPYNMDYHDPVQNLVIEQEKGYRLLNGEDAMQVIRWRKNDKTSPYGYHNGIGDSGRMKVQQDFLKAVIEQLLKPENVLNIGKIVQVFQESVETDLSFQNMLWFGKQAASGGLSSDNITFLTMPWKSAEAWSYYYHTYLDYVVPIPDELLDVVNNQLSPFVNKFTLSDLDIMSVNADGSLHSTTGHLEDSRASKPVSVSSGTQDSKGENSNSIESEANLPSNDSASQSPSNSDTLPVDPNESTTSDSNPSPTIPDDNEESKPDESPDESPKDTMDEAGETLPSTSGDSSFSIISPAPIS